jgi:uncharacterized protein
MPAGSDMTAKGRDAHEAAALYVGKVMHARLKPFLHRFSYRVMSLLIDLDRLDDADRQSRLFGVNRAAVYSFHEADHGLRDGSSLRAYAQACAQAHGIDLTGGRVLLLCYPRLFGYAFNPLSVYFCHRAGGELALIIYEVRNTFGGIHAYALPVRPDDVSKAGIRQAQDKTFHVSPFITMAARYHFRITPPSDYFRLRILQTDDDGPLLATTFSAARRRLTSANLLGSLAALPLVSFKIIAAIHWQALRLWLKGARLMPRCDNASAMPDTGLAQAGTGAYTQAALTARRGRALVRRRSRRARPLTRKFGHRAT